MHTNKMNNPIIENRFENAIKEIRAVKDSDIAQEQKINNQAFRDLMLLQALINYYLAEIEASDGDDRIIAKITYNYLSQYYDILKGEHG